MAISTAQYIDLLFKKLNGVAKTATAAQKSSSNESIASPPLLRGDIVWMQSDQIPSSAQVVAGITQGYLATNRIECVPDTTVPTIGGIYPTWLTNLTDWIPQEFGSSWPVKIYVDTAGASDPTVTGTQIFSPGVGGVGEFFFDTQAGLLNFIGETIPSSLTAGKSIFVVGYRYVGLLGVTNLPSGTKIGNLEITGNTIASLNTDGDIVLDPDGSGQVVISSSLTVSGTIYGNISGNISGNITVPGANGDVLFNTSNIPNASSALNFDYSTNVLSVTGNIIGSNVTTGGLILATGNITGGNLNTAGLVKAATASITGNVEAGNVNSANIIAAQGNISGSNVVTGGLVTAIGNVITAGVETTQLSGNSITITATGLNQGISLVPNGLGNINVNSRYINNLLDPAQDQDAATKAYVDSVAQGLDIKGSVNIATTAPLGAYTYNNGSSGVGATITGASVGVLTIDGETVALNDRVLVKNEPSAGGFNAYNGIYLCTTAGDAGTAYVLTRSTDFNQPAEMYSAFAFVEYGSVNADTGWVCTNNTSTAIVVGTTPIVFTQFSGAGAYTAGNGLSTSGTQFNVNVDPDTTTINGSNQVAVKASANLTTPNIGAATGSSLSLTGNIDALNINATGYVSATGNVIGGNINTAGLLSVAGNVNSGNVNTGAISLTGNVISDLAVTGNITGATVVSVGNMSGANITTLGIANIATLEVTGNANIIGNVSGNYFLGNGSLLTGIDATSIQNGNSNVRVTANGNITVGVAGTGNVVVFADTGVYVTGVTSASGNITGGNIDTAGTANVGILEVTSTASVVGNITTTANISGGFILGNGSLLTGIDATSIQNGNSNVRVSANGNVTVGVAGTGNVLVIADTGAIVSGIVSVTGNITANGVLTDNYYYANGAPVDFEQPAGSNTWIQYNDNDSFGASGALVFDSAANIFTVGGNIVGNNVSTNVVTSTGQLTISSAVDGNILLDPDGTGIFKIVGTNGFVVPVGNTTQRPDYPTYATVDTGTLRLNTTLNQLEIWNGAIWSIVGSDSGNISVLDQQITPDGSSTVYVLTQNATAASIIVSLNGVVQIPNSGYTVTGNSLTFVEPPLTTDIVDIRFLTGVTAPSVLYNSTANSSVQVTDTPDIVMTVNNTVRATVNAVGLSVTGNITGTGNVAGTYFIGNGSQLTGISASSVAEASFSIQTSNFNATAGSRYGVDTTSGAVTATLPSLPATGAAIFFADAGGAYASNNLTINPNGGTIMSASGNMTVSTNNQSVGLFYNGTTWRTYNAG